MPALTPSRRDAVVGLLAVGMAGMAHAAAAEDPLSFPNGFLWGASASAPQTEGRDGRGPSLWDAFAARPGSIKDGSTMAVGTGFERLFTIDIGLVADAGLKAFRFSIAWPRVQPTGQGPADPKGLDLYDRMVDAMLARGLEPWPTLFHWDLPAELGLDWRDRDMAARFADYAAIVGKRLGDRVRHWLVLNEPSTVAVFGYAFGWHPPQAKDLSSFCAAAHHQNLAQGLGFRALRAVLPASARIGTSLNIQESRPADGLPENAEAAAIVDDAFNGMFLGPLYGHPYPARFADALAPLIRRDDLAVIAAQPDFLGVNFYDGFNAKPAPGDPLGATIAPPPPGVPRTGSGLGIEPDVFRATLNRVKRDAGDPLIYVTENGASFPDPPPADGLVDDPERVRFYRDYLLAAVGAIRDGVRLGGFFAWAATDNWEWRDGFTSRFGLVAVDRTTLSRTPKRSLGYLGGCARENRVVEV